MKETPELIRDSSLGRELTEKEAMTLAGLMSAHILKDGEFLIKEGTQDNALHVILEGRLEVTKLVGGDDEMSLAILKTGDMAGELGFVDGQKHTVGLRALSGARVVSLSRTDFESIVNNEPTLVYKVMRAIVRSTHRIVHRMNHEFIELNNYVFKQHGRY
ncbi:MAG: cyclic nucleotide-binding domain-containing protein [Woeseiaceae bacterium]|nr:cyclic nucleotide-binding domain-containing protein [Woeseiaceae bacterium]